MNLKNAVWVERKKLQKRYKNKIVGNWMVLFKDTITVYNGLSNKRFLRGNKIRRSFRRFDIAWFSLDIDVKQLGSFSNRQFMI